MEDEIPQKFCFLNCIVKPFSPVQRTNATNKPSKLSSVRCHSLEVTRTIQQMAECCFGSRTLFILRSFHGDIQHIGNMQGNVWDLCPLCAFAGRIAGSFWDGECRLVFLPERSAQLCAGSDSQSAVRPLPRSPA